MVDTIITLEMQGDQCSVEVPVDAWLRVKVYVNDRNKKVLTPSRTRTQRQRQTCLIPVQMQELLRIDVYDGNGEAQLLSHEYRREKTGLVLIERYNDGNGVQIEVVEGPPRMVEDVVVKHTLYEPIIEMVETFSPQDFEEVQPACTTCRARITTCPFYRIQVPVYLDTAYFTDSTAYACSFEHMLPIQAEQTDPTPFHFDEVPSEEEKRGWIYAFFNHPTYPRDTFRKWKMAHLCSERKD